MHCALPKLLCIVTVTTSHPRYETKIWNKRRETK
jgi:hypothetical protein